MNRLRRLIVCAVLAAGFTGTVWSRSHAVETHGQLRVVGTQLCNEEGEPVQLRGMSTHGLQWYGWGNCVTSGSLDALADDWKADVLRISMYVQEGGYATNPSGFTQQVRTIIDQVTARGMYALVDFHQLSPGDPMHNLDRAKTFFTAIATSHGHQNNILYDICNEPNGVSWARIREYAVELIPVIRAIDSTAPILIGTHGWASLGISDGRTAQDIVNNPVPFTNILYTFHFYARSHRTRYLQELDWASARLPIFVTEFGTQEYTGDGPNDFPMAQQFLDLMRARKIGWCNWNYSADFRSGAVWKTGTCSSGPWTTNNLKEAGLWIRERIREDREAAPPPAEEGEILYRETFGRHTGGDANPNMFGWQVFGRDGQALTGAWINSSASGRPADAFNSPSAGPHSDGSYTPYALGIHYFGDATTQTPSLSFTPEFSFDPGHYVPGTIQFSWYQGNQSGQSRLRLIVRTGAGLEAKWYAHAASFANGGTHEQGGVGLSSFGVEAVLRPVIYDPAPEHWRELNFDGAFDPGSGGRTNSSLGALGLGGAPAQALSGRITAFGIYGEQIGGTGNRRFDTFTIRAEKLPPEPLRLAVRMDGGGIGFSFPTDPGSFYRVEFKESLAASAWSTLRRFQADARMAVIEEEGLEGRAARYYRVVWEQGAVD